MVQLKSKSGRDLDEYVSRHGRFRLLLDLREFDGWQGLVVGDHLSVVRTRHRAPTRVAVVDDTAWMKMAQKVMSSFLEAIKSYFGRGDLEGARAWLLA